MNEKPKIFEYFDKFAALIPIPLYWFDADGVFWGGNELCLKVTGAYSLDEFIGKTNKQVHPQDIALGLEKNLELAISTGKTIEAEEEINDLATGKKRSFITLRSPLTDENDVVVGVICTSIEITDKKNAERLQIENEAHKTKLQEQEKFRSLAEQVAHDIRSPLASLSMIVGACKNLPESERITLRDVTIGINDIANNLLNRYKKDENEAEVENKTPQHILISLALSEILSEKKYQYKNSPVKFHCFVEPDSDFVFVEANPSNFHRMISNLINNAVEAFEDREGIVDLKLNLDGEHVKVTIQDNGKGMPQGVIDKIMNNIAVTSGKKNGSGIGLTQVRSTLQSSKGKISIESDIGKGTKIVLTFPRGETADWIQEEIELHKEDIVIVLDDDSSIHGAWNARFKPYGSDIQLHHFKLGIEVIEFIDSLIPKEEGKIFLLSDFELINQEFDGLQIIEQTRMQQHSVLVTSHHNNQTTRDLAAKCGVKILPKQLVFNVPITIKEKTKDENIASPFKKVDLIIIDDNQIFADCLASFFQSKSLKVDAYYNPKRFLENLSQYTKDTNIFMDNDFSNQISGFELAKQLNEAGYTRLYLLTGQSFEEKVIPSYLTPLLKGDMEALNKLVLTNSQENRSKES